MQLIEWNKHNTTQMFNHRTPSLAHSYIGDEITEELLARPNPHFFVAYRADRTGPESIPLPKNRHLVSRGFDRDREGNPWEIFEVHCHGRMCG